MIAPTNYELILIEEGSETAIVRVIVNEGVMKMFVADFVNENGWLGLDEEQIKEPKVREPHFDGLTRKHKIFAKSETNSIVAIYPGLRLTEDLVRPLTIVESSTKPLEFQILNSNELYVDPDQSVFGNAGLPGGLMVRTGSKRYLMLPLTEHDSTEELEKPAVIEFIAIVDDLPAPQTRLQRLLLAYYCVLAFEYRLAKDLLNPVTSLRQNEVFSVPEIEIMTWIMSSPGHGPEAMFIKIMAYMHLIINNDKFCIEYTELNGNDPLSETRSKLVQSMALKIKDLLIGYLMSIRDLSEKYYIFNIFPEILSTLYWEQLFDKLSLDFGASKPMTSERGRSFDIHYIWKPDGLTPYAIDFGDVVDMGYFYKMINPQTQTDPKYQKLWLRFIPRVLDNNVYEPYLLASYCMIKSPEIWSSFKEEFKNNNTQLCNEHFKTCMTKCIDRYDDDFSGFYFETSSITEVKSILKVFKEDLKTKTFDSDDVRLEPGLDAFFLKENQSRSFEALREKLIYLGTGNDSKTIILNASFNSSLQEKCKILSKLSKSINDFTEEQRTKMSTEILSQNASEILKAVRDIVDLIDKAVIDMNISIKQTEDWLKLATMTSSNAKMTLDLEDVTNNTEMSLDLLNRLMHKKKVKSFTDLYACYLSNSLSCFQKKFLHLSKEDCVRLQKTTFSFYSRQVLQDHFLFIREKAEAILKTPLDTENGDFAVTSEDLELLCDELKKISDMNSRHVNPVILNFEFRSKKYRLRSEQVTDIKLLTTIDPKTQNYSSVVIQRMMAAGKTLVLGTISIVTKAIGRDKLSILVPPSSLYQSNTTAMQERTYHYFKRAGSNFSFPRFPIPTNDYSYYSNYIETNIHRYLDHIIELLNRTMETGNYLILSPDSLQSFHNSYVEFLNACTGQQWNYTVLKILPKYATIYNIFREKGTIILDEIDMTMDPRKELNFPTIEEEPYNMMAASLMTDIFEFIVFDTEIKSAGLDILGNNQASLTTKGYNKCRELILNYIEKQLDDPTSIWTKFIFSHNEDGSVVLKPQDIMTFLRSPEMDADVDWIQSILKVLPRIIVDSIIIIKVQVYSYLEDSLRGTVNQNYGSAGDARPEIKYAVPYVAANTPSPTSIFADRWETLNKTLLMNVSAPCTVNTTKEIIDYLRSAIFGEFDLDDQTLASRMNSNFRCLLPEIKPKNLDPSNAKQVQMIHQALNRKSPAAIRIIFNYTLKEVVSNMKFRTEQITSNALNMTSMFGSIQGYSGTIDNVNILPQAVIADAYVDNLNNEKNNGGISLKLMKDCNDEIVPEIGNEVFKEPVRSLIREIISKQSPETIDNLSAIIDAGAFFKNFTNIQIAEGILLEFSRIEAVIYYDETSNQLEFICRSGDSYARGYLSSSDPDVIAKTTHVDINSRFTFYDQRHITGSDILQPKHAHAVMTVATRVLLRDILQGTLRMRQFMTTQKVHLVTTASTREFYYSQCSHIVPEYESRDHVKVSDILSLGALNEDEKQRNENEKLAFLKIDNEIRTFILSEISRKLESDEIIYSDSIISGLFTPSKSIFVRSIKEDPLQWLQRPDIAESDISLKKYKELRFKNLTDYRYGFGYEQLQYREELKVLSEKVDLMISKETRHEPASLLFYLPETMQRREGMSGLGTEVQMEVLSQVDLNLDQIVEEKKAGIVEAQHKMMHLHDLNSLKSSKLENSEAYVSLYRVLNGNSISIAHKPLVEVASLSEGHRVGISIDLLKLYSNDFDNFQLFSRYNRDGTHLLVQVLTNSSNTCTGVSVFLLSIENARSIYEQLTNTSSRYYSSFFWLCDLSGRVTTTNDPKTVNQNVLEFIPEARVPIFDALIFNGSLLQILSNPRLYGIYKHCFLSGADSNNRASFLMLRMKTLRGKDSMLFDKKNPEMINLQNIIKGSKVGTDACIKGFYPKPAILKSDETLYNLSIGFDREKFNSEFESSTKLKSEHSSIELKPALIEIFGSPKKASSSTSLPEFTRFNNSYGPNTNFDTTKHENVLTDPTPQTVSEKWSHIPHLNSDDKESIDVTISENILVEGENTEIFDDEDDSDSDEEQNFEDLKFELEFEDENVEISWFNSFSVIIAVMILVGTFLIIFTIIMMNKMKEDTENQDVEGESETKNMESNDESNDNETETEAENEFDS